MAKFFISYNSADSQKAQWIAWTLEEMGHTTFVHEWEIAGGQSIPKWMEDRLAECDHVLAVFSPDYIDAAYSMSERHSVFWRDPVGREGRLLPVIVRPCAMPELLHDRKRIDLLDLDEEDAVKRLGDFIAPPRRPSQRPAYKHEGSPGSAGTAYTAPSFVRADSNNDAYNLSNLPAAHSDELIGRDGEMAELTKEWANRARCNVVALIAEGGTGKSYLVACWLAELQKQAPAPYAGAQRIFTWSFYSQGLEGQVTSSEPFFAELIRSFGEDPDQLDSWAKEAKASELVQAQEMILVLDGIEPLQNPPGHTDAGRFYDILLGSFINRLAKQAWPGLILITTRQRLTEFEAMEGQTVHQIELSGLSPEDGARLLASFGVSGPPLEIQAASNELNGHPLSLAMLAKHLVDVQGNGDVQNRADAFQKLNVLSKEDLEVAARIFEDGPGSSEQAKALLRLLAFFERPIFLSDLKELIDLPVDGVCEELSDYTSQDIEDLVAQVSKARLILETPDKKLDVHPVIRDHYKKGLLHSNISMNIGQLYIATYFFRMCLSEKNQGNKYEILNNAISHLKLHDEMNIRDGNIEEIIEINHIVLVLNTHLELKMRLYQSAAAEKSDYNSRKGSSRGERNSNENVSQANDGWYVSYAWSDDKSEVGLEREALVDQLCVEASERGIRIFRDKRDLEVGDSISAFMKKLASGRRIFIFLSEKYLKSSYCMSELIDAWVHSRQDEHEFMSRVRVFTLENVDYRSNKGKQYFINFWKEKEKEKSDYIKQTGWDYVSEKDLREHNKFRRISLEIAKILSVLSDRIQTESFDEFRSTGFN